MVKVGFICEGDTEKIVVESDNFQQLLRAHNLTCIQPVINAGSCSKLLPNNIEGFRQTLLDNGAEVIIILTDLDADACVAVTKARITERANQLIVVAVREIEAWFLADTQAMSTYLQTHFYMENPEMEQDPFQTIHNLSLNKKDRGVSNKKILARNIIKSGFTLQHAAQHPNCRSAKYFYDKLRGLAK